MAKIEDIVEIHKNIADSLGKRMTAFEEKLLSSPQSSDMNKPSLERLLCDYNEFKTSVWNILGLLKSLIHNVAAQIDDVDNQTRRNALLFTGIEENEGENLISTILSTIQVLMGLSDVQPSAIQQCHRLGARSDGRARPILVRFTDLNIRNLIFNNKRALKSSSVVLNEFLTKPRQDMFARARKHFGMTNCWTRNGAIFIKLPNGERLRVANLEVLDDLISKHPFSSSSSTSNSLATTSKTNDLNNQPQLQHKVTPVSVTKSSMRPVTRKHTVKKV